VTLRTTIRQHLATLARATLLGLVLAFALPATTAFADNLREVAERIARQNDAKVVSARVVERNGQKFYVIRILTRDGVVKTIRVPARDRKHLSNHVGAVSDRDPAPERIANRSSLPRRLAAGT